MSDQKRNLKENIINDQIDIKCFEEVYTDILDLVNKKKEKLYKIKTNKKLIDIRWIVTVTISAFVISIMFSFLSEVVISNVTATISVLMLLVVIIVGVVSDMIGISVTVADIRTFNSMASKRVKGASLAVKFIKNADKVSSFLNDVIGDICGIISGALSSSIAIMLVSKFSFNILLVTLFLTGFVASLTIGGKALGKSFAINKSNIILFNFSRFLAIFIRK